MSRSRAGKGRGGEAQVVCVVGAGGQEQIWQALCALCAMLCLGIIVIFHLLMRSSLNLASFPLIEL